MRLQAHPPALDLRGNGAVGLDSHHLAAVEFEQEAALPAEPHVGLAVTVQVQFRAESACRCPANIYFP